MTEDKHPAGIDPELVDDPAATNDDPAVIEDEVVVDDPPVVEGDDPPVAGDEVVETEAEKVAREKEQMFQTRYQRMLGKVKTRDPELAAEMTRELRTESREDARRGDDPADDLKDIDEDATLADLPLSQALDLIDKRSEKRMSAMLQKSNQASQVNETMAALSADLGDMANIVGLNQEQIDTVIAEANAVVPEDQKKIPGGPERWARVAAKEIAYMRAKGITVDPRKVTADAEDKVRKDLATTQPGRTATPAAQPSEKARRLKEMSRVGPKSTTGTLLDSERK